MTTTTITCFHNTSATGANAFCRGTFKRGYDRNGGWKNQETKAVKEYNLGEVTPPIYFSVQPTEGEKRVPTAYGQYAVEAKVDFAKGFFTYSIGDSAYNPMELIPSGVDPEEFLLDLYTQHVLNGKVEYIELHWWANELPEVAGVWTEGTWDLRGCVFLEYNVWLRSY